MKGRSSLISCSNLAMTHSESGKSDPMKFNWHTAERLTSHERAELEQRDEISFRKRPVCKGCRKMVELYCLHGSSQCTCSIKLTCDSQFEAGFESLTSQPGSRNVRKRNSTCLAIKQRILQAHSDVLLLGTPTLQLSIAREIPCSIWQLQFGAHVKFRHGPRSSQASCIANENIVYPFLTMRRVTAL